jgi:hypothetical protein
VLVSEEIDAVTTHEEPARAIGPGRIIRVVRPGAWAPWATRSCRRLVIALAVVLAAATATACTAHHEALTRACPTVAGRGVVALEKLGLSAEELKVQEKC